MSHKSIIYYDKDEFSSLEKEDRFIFFMKSAQKKAGKGEFALCRKGYPRLIR